MLSVVTTISRVSRPCVSSDSSTSETFDVATVIWLSDAERMRQSPLNAFFRRFRRAAVVVVDHVEPGHAVYRREYRGRRVGKAFVAVSGSGVASAFVSGADAATVSGLKLMVGMVEVVCAFMAQNAAVKAARPLTVAIGSFEFLF